MSNNTASIITGDFVSFKDERTGRTRFGRVVQVLPDYAMRINVGGKIIRVEDKTIEKAEF
ncbi:hypothetical protein EniyanLRS_150 [Mycobacterium phage EniyanLRS]|nr:hypothetical protein EniyanLRS_150 [Mycobacterium phage EniyanLRS]QGJ90016.1 hypothetical protein PBI_MARYV_143 [Mycobacterium phage MaryV]WKR36139.1 hypothetical protein [Mycobacterium phage Azrael100]